MKELRVWWSQGPRPGNLGDVLTPVILKGFGYRPTWTDREAADFLCIGSIARFARPGQRVVGSGVMWSSDLLNPEAEWLAVRGPITRGRVLSNGGRCSEVEGDPALLLPEFFDPLAPKRFDVGIVPHYVDFERVRSLHPEVPLINPLRADPLDVVFEVLQCRSILSSSLHGIILAHAYGIPAAWVRFSDGLDGDDVKFQDYAESVGIELDPAPNVYAADPVLPVGIDTAPLREVFECL